MTASRAAFIDSIPEYYGRYLGPLIFEEYGADLAQRVSVPPGERVLETASGTGIATRHLRNALPKDVRIVVTDLSEPMLECAKHKLDSQANIEFQSVDATQLAFAEASFDAVVCQFSLMFFPAVRRHLCDISWERRSSSRGLSIRTHDRAKRRAADKRVARWGEPVYDYYRNSVRSQR